jgi:DNA polymerase V
MHATVLGRSDDFPTLTIPLFSDSVPAGFPSPATDYCEKTLDLNQLCIKKPAATYFARTQGGSMLGAGIFPGDILVVDRSQETRHGDVVIVELNSELTVKRLELKPQRRLSPMNRKYSPIVIPEDLLLI